MRAAYVCADAGVPVFGAKGAANHVRAILRALRRRGVEATLFAVRTGGDAPADLADMHVIPIDIPRSGDARERARAALAANVVTHRALTEAGPFDLVYERHALWSWSAMCAGAALGARTVLEVNAPLLEEQASARVLPSPRIAERAARRAFGCADALIAVSPAVGAWLDGFTEARGRVSVVANGVDAALFTPAQRPPEAFTVGFVGTLKPWHDLSTLVDGFARLAAARCDARLLVVGDGPRRAALEADLAARGLTNRATLTGAIDAAEVPGLLRRMSVGVAPYSAGQPFYFSPLKLYEYMAAGLPVLASRIGHLPDVVRDGVDGILTAPDDGAALGAALIGLADDPGHAARLGTAARARAVSELGWDAALVRILAAAGMGERRLADREDAA